MKRIVLSLVILAAFLPGTAGAQLIPTGYNPPFNVRTPRALGMGNTQVGIGGDYSSLFYNPAGLSTLDVSAGGDDIGSFEVQVFSAMWETNADTTSFLKDLTDLGGFDGNAATLTPLLLIFLNKHLNEPIYTRGNTTSYFTTKKGRFGLGVALVGDWTVEGSIQNLFIEGVGPQSADTLIARRTMDVGGVVGLSFDIIEKFLAVGTNLKVFNRWQTTSVQGDILNGIADVVANGELGDTGDHLPDFSFDPDIIMPFGDCGKTISPVGAGGGGQFGCTHFSDLTAGVDLGAMFMLPFDEIPAFGNLPLFEGSQLQFGVTWQDVGRTRLKHVDLSSPTTPQATLNTLISGAQEDIASTVDVGVGYIQNIAIGNFKIGMDIRDLNRDEIDVADKLSFGAELELEKFLTLRAGLNETGAAVGATLRAGIVRLEGGFFQEKTELPSSGRDERFFVSAGFGWYN